MLPILGDSASMSATEISSCLAISVVVESVVLLVATGQLEKYSRKKLLSISMGLRSLAFAPILISGTYTVWLVSFILIAFSKALSKPFTREVLSTMYEGARLKRSLIFYSFSQNLAIVIAPLIAIVSLRYGHSREVMQILVIMNLMIGILSAANVYNYPKNRNASSQFVVSRNSFLLQFAELKNNRDIVNILLSTFFCFAIMGFFISSTTIIDRIKEVFYGYSGVFFSIVGVSVCIWQGLVAPMTKFSERTTIHIIAITGVLSSLYLTGGVYLAIASLIAYSIYESVIIPHIYYKSSNCESSLSISVIFSYILVASNVGEAVGASITGLVVDLTHEYAPFYLFLLIFVSALFSARKLARV